MKINKSPAFQFYPRDWISSSKVTTMSCAHRGAYVQLLCYDWLDDGIPDNDEHLAILSGLGEGWLKGGSQMVRKCFMQHPTKPNFLTNQRLIEEREKQAKWKDKSSKGGKKGSITRLNKANNIKMKGGSQMVEECLQPNANSSTSFASSSSDNKYMCIKEENRSFPTLEQVKAVCPKMGVPEKEAEAIWNHFESCGWIDRNGRAITNWQAKIKSCWSSEESKRMERDHHRKGPNFGDKAQIKGKHNGTQEEIPVRVIKIG